MTTRNICFWHKIPGDIRYLAIRIDSPPSFTEGSRCSPYRLVWSTRLHHILYFTEFLLKLFAENYPYRLLRGVTIIRIFNTDSCKSLVLAGLPLSFTGQKGKNPILSVLCIVLTKKVYWKGEKIWITYGYFVDSLLSLLAGNRFSNRIIFANRRPR